MTFDTTTIPQFRAGATNHRVGMKGAALWTTHDEVSTVGSEPASDRGAQRVARVESAGAFKLSTAVFSTNDSLGEIHS